MKFGWQKLEINYLTDKSHNRRSRGCNVNAAPLGTFFQESHSCLLLVEPFQRHTLPSADWTSQLRSQAEAQGCLSCACCWQKHPLQRFSILLCTTCEAFGRGGHRPDHLAVSQTMNKFFLRLLFHFIFIFIFYFYFYFLFFIFLFFF